MGALDTLQDFVQTKVEKVVNKVTGRGSKNAATPGRGDTTHGELPGFPFVNYASERVNVRPMIIPRVKYTYGVQFNINPDALLDGIAITNISKFLSGNGYLYQQLKRIDHPKPAFAVETLRSYNKYVKLPTKMEFPPASMTFDDDATSITTALLKEYINFYSYSGNVGSQLVQEGNTSSVGPTPPPNFNSSFADTAFSFDQSNVGYNHLIANSATDQPRQHMNLRPSMGLKLKANHKRHFFDSIIIYDLGIDPNSVNIYYFYKPVITTIDHAGLDTEDRTSKVEITMNFEYENYYFAIGRNRLEVADAIELLTGVRPSKDITNNFFPNTHGAMEVIKVPKTPMPDSGGPDPIPLPGELPVDPYGAPGAPRPPGEIEADIDRVRQELGGVAAASSSTGGDDPEATFEKMRLTNKLKLLNEELNDSAKIASDIQKAEQAAPATKSAAENTKKKAINETLSRSEALIKEIQDSDGLTDEQKKNLIAQITEESVNRIRRLSNTIRGVNTLKNEQNKYQGPPKPEPPPHEKNVNSSGEVLGLTKEQWTAVESKNRTIVDKTNAENEILEVRKFNLERGIDKANSSFFGPGDQSATRATIAELDDKIRKNTSLSLQALNDIGTAQIAQDQITAWENAQMSNDPV